MSKAVAPGVGAEGRSVGVAMRLRCLANAVRAEEAAGRAGRLVIINTGGLSN